jgi:putative acetyltransferase
MERASAPSVPFAWRPATAADVAVLATLYRTAARRFGPLVYTPAQVDAWAGFAEADAVFRAYVLEADTWVAERIDDAVIQGFCGVARAGELREIHSLYVRPEATRRGLGGEMLRRTLERAQAAGARRFAAWATPFGRPVFLRAGFTWTQTVQGLFGGTMFERYRVERAEAHHPRPQPATRGV